MQYACRRLMLLSLCYTEINASIPIIMEEIRTPLSTLTFMVLKSLLPTRSIYLWYSLLPQRNEIYLVFIHGNDDENEWHHVKKSKVVDAY